MTVIADGFPKLPSPKKVIRWMSIKSGFGGQFENKHTKTVQRMLKSAPRYLYNICWSMWILFSWKKCVLVLCKILGLFLNTLTDDEKYCLLYRKNWMQPIQILLSQKKKTFSHFFSPFLKSTLNFQQSQTKMTLLADVFPKLPSPKKVIG